jgi:hypothetical protein
VVMYLFRFDNVLCWNDISKHLFITMISITSVLYLYFSFPIALTRQLNRKLF